MQKRNNLLWRLRNFIIAVFIGLFLVVIGYVWIISTNSPVIHKRFSDLPNNAVWIGGADAGFWFHIVSIDSIKRTYRFRIYNDYDGKMVMDGNFKKDDHCMGNYPLNKNIVSEINLFQFNEIVMKNNCSLKLIKPAYGGTFP